MANQNFVVHNGLSVGSVTIDAATSNIAIPVTKQLAIGNIILRDNGDGKLHLRDITDNNDAVLVATVTATSTTDGNIQIGTNHIESINPNGPISLRPNGTGPLVFAANLISAGKGAAELTIATGMAMPAEYGVTYANANIILSPGRLGYGGNVWVNQNTPATSSSTGAFTVLGGAGIGGNLYVGGNLFVAGNTTIVNSTINNDIVGNLQIGLPLNFSAPYANVSFGTNINSYSQINAQNQSSGAAASTDYVATANNGNDSTFFIDMGINGSGYSQLTPFTGSFPRDGYIYVAGNGTGIGGGNLMLATMHTANPIFLAVGGQDTTSIIASITSNGIIPGSSNAKTLGNTTHWWSSIWGLAVNAQYADLAEKYQADAAYEPGTVLMFGGEAEVTVADVDTPRVAGVVSTQPGYLMNGSLANETAIELALTGRVPCKVTGTVRKGDLMTSAGGGYAHANPDAKMGTVIGKALEDHDGLDGVIEVVVGRL